MTSSGGVAAAFGFRYQYVVTVGMLLDLYEESDLTSWYVDVDMEGQDSADILISRGGSGWDVAVQVKASQETASTTLGAPDVRRIFDFLATEHPTVGDRRLVTNRVLTRELAKDGKGSLWARKAGESTYFDYSPLGDLIQELLDRVAGIRERGTGGLTVQHIVLSQLIDMVHQRGSDRNQQRITRGDIAHILDEPAALLADAGRSRSWGRMIQVPHGRPIARDAMDSYLRRQLPLESLQTGLVRCAVFSGLSGTGKSSSVVRLAQERAENLAFVLWLDASSDDTLQAQLPKVLKELGAPGDEGDPSEIFRTALSQVPVPWLLVMDSASDADAIEKWVPSSGYGHVVVTSTSTSWPPNFSAFSTVQGFSSGEAREFLSTRFEVPQERWSIEQKRACDELAKRLEYWPLALEIATAWIWQRHGKFDDISVFVHRLDRLDLDDSTLVPHGYPTTAFRVVMDLLDSITEDAKTLAIGIVLMGGHRVPSALLDTWTMRLDPGVEARNELMRHNVVGLSVNPDQRGPHIYDETVEMHDAVRLILESSRRGISIETDALNELVTTCCEQVEQLIAEERFIEAATLLPPVDELLNRCVSSFAPREIPGAWTTLMHNVGSIAVLIDGASPDPGWAMRIARRWLSIALNIRKELDGRHKPVAIAALQVETLGSLACVLHKLHEDDELLKAAWLAVEYGEPYGAELNQIGTTVPEALHMIQEAIAQSSKADENLLVRLSKLEEATSRGDHRRSASPLVDELQQQMVNAVELVDHAKLQDGIDLALRVAETAWSKGVLIDKSIDCLLDIGVTLLAVVVQRPVDNQYARLMISRLLEGVAPRDRNLRHSQRVRSSLLEAVASNDSKKLLMAIREAKEAREDSRVSVSDKTILTAWIQVAEIINEHNTRLSLFSGAGEGFTLFTSSGDLQFWEALDIASGVPMLFVHNPSSFVFDSAGKRPVGHEPFVESGLTVTTDPATVRPLAQGWHLKFQEDGLWIYSSNGQALVQQVSTTSKFKDRVLRAGGVLLIYHDATRLSAEPLVAPAGWISIPKYPRRRGWRRFIPW
jgi:hypothetical protein